MGFRYNDYRDEYNADLLTAHVDKIRAHLGAVSVLSGDNLVYIYVNVQIQNYYYIIIKKIL